MKVSPIVPNGLDELLSYLFVRDIALEKSRLECKLCYYTPICIALCHALIIYVYSTFFEMSRTCIHLGIHEHLVSNGTCFESLDIAYQSVANKVIKPHTTKNYVVVLSVCKQFLADYLFKYPSSDMFVLGGHYGSI